MRVPTKRVVVYYLFWLIVMAIILEAGSLAIYYALRWYAAH